MDEEVQLHKFNKFSFDHKQEIQVQLAMTASNDDVISGLPEPRSLLN